MVKKDFDNLFKVLNAGLVFTGATLASVEVDFELPRGYIAKIWRIELGISNFGDDFNAISIDKNAVWNLVLIRDPDDIVTTSFTSNQTQHDVVANFIVDVLIVAGTAGDPGYVVSETKYAMDIPEHVDLITARNMRFTVQGGDDDAADLTETVGGCNIYYTLEKVNDADILELLDIL